MNLKPPLIILSGPTAVGKTSLSVEFARLHDLEIISADSAQVYKEMDIGTAKIKEEEKKGVPHYLIDVCDRSEDYSAFKFSEMAGDCIEAIRNHGRIPFVVGGTGFYIQALLKGVEFDDEGPDEEYRDSLEKIAEEKGCDYLHEMLRSVDDVSANRIPPQNIKRVIRALEYNHLTGRRISDHNENEAAKEPVFNAAYFVLTDDRELIYQRIDRRVDEMLEAGLEKEVRSILESGTSPESVSMQAIGYKEMIPYIKGEISLEEAAYLIKLRTRHFAKRQLTWYKRETDVIMMDRREFNGDVNAMTEFMSAECKRRGLF